MTIHLAPQGPYSAVKRFFDTYPDWPRAHALDPSRTLGIGWPHPKGNRIAPDHGFLSSDPDSVWNRSRWRRIEESMVERLLDWSTELVALSSEPIIINEEQWLPVWGGEPSWRTGRTPQRHHAFLDAKYWQAVEAMGLVWRDAPTIGCSGIFSLRHGRANYNPIDFQHRRIQSTLGMDFNAPQLYFREGVALRDDLQRFTDEIDAAPHLRCVPFVSPFFERKEGQAWALPDSFMWDELARTFYQHRITDCIVWCNSGVDPEKYREPLELLRKGLGDFA